MDPQYLLTYSGGKVVSLAPLVGNVFTKASCYRGTLAQCQAKITALGLTALDVTSAKETALAALQAAYDAAVATGFADTGNTGATFAITPTSLATFNNLNTLLTLAGTASSAAISWGASPHVVDGILDIDNNVVAMTFGQFQALMVRLGNYVATLQAKLASLSAAIAAATTVDAVQAVPAFSA